jgi:AcrR family transcriptional regulator
VSALDPLDDHPVSGRLSLSEEAHNRARTRILDGAMATLAERGLEASVDEVARAAGVSRRTVFRHFASQGELFAASITEVWRVIDDGIPAPPTPGMDMDVWLTETSVAMHALLRQVIGRAFWDVHVVRPGTTPEVIEALSALSTERRRHALTLAGGAWSVLGGQGDVASWVVDAFILQLSGFATNAMAAYDAHEAGRVSARILSSVLASALAEQRDGTVARGPAV